jgi:hypothetical protein
MRAVENIMMMKITEPPIFYKNNLKLSRQYGFSETFVIPSKHL